MTESNCDRACRGAQASEFVRGKAVGIALSAASAAVAVSYLVRLTRIRRNPPYIGETEKNLRS